MKKIILYFVFIIATVLMLAGLFIIFKGSFEMFPTEEQTGKAIILGVIIALSGTLINAASIFVYKNMDR
ncbi:MAG: hypothetical protein IKN47_04830 [Lachnospiraceae bacterium]|nr:hypothetical protein [Lachnospiraceae bacterium]